jgi:lysophospholipase L1-like esterase
MPGSRRNPLSKLPRPGLPGGLPNPVQAVRNLAFFLNPTNIIILSLIGIFISVFFIVLLFGGGGGGGGSTVGGGAPPVPPVGGQSTYTFVALGDSLTAWPCYPVDAGCVDSHPWGSYDFTGSPWPTHLATIDTNLILKHNSGLPAKTSAYIESQFGSQVTPYHPDVLFILAGTNDPGNGITNPEVTKANIEKMISDAKSVGIKKVILLTIPHQCGSGYTDINNVIKTLASDYSPVIDISSTSVLACSDFQTSDKLHLTDSGALKLAQYIDGQIINRGLLPAPSSGPANLVFYCQWSPYSSVGGGSWYSHTYTDGTVADKGCGPTSMAIIVSSFGNTQHPDVVGDAFTKDGMMYCDSSGCDGTAYWPGSNPTAIKAWLAGFGLKASDMNLEQGGVLNETGVSKILPQQGSSYLLFGEIKNYIADSNPKLHGGHMVVITAINTSNKTITLYNPEYCHTGNHAETVSYTANIGYGGVPYDWGQIVPFGPVGQ